MTNDYIHYIVDTKALARTMVEEIIVSQNGGYEHPENREAILLRYYFRQEVQYPMCPMCHGYKKLQKFHAPEIDPHMHISELPKFFKCDVDLVPCEMCNGEGYKLRFP